MLKKRLSQAAQILQDFMPINPFYADILMETKGFTTKEVSNEILPFFFYSSFFIIFVGFVIIQNLGRANTFLFSYISQAFMPALVLFIPKRNFLAARILYFLGGAGTSLKSILLSLTIKDTSDKKTSYALIKLLRYSCGFISASVGQETLNETGSYNLIIYLSIISSVVTAFIGFVTSFIFKAAPSDVAFIFTPSDFFSKLSQIFTKENKIATLCSSSAALMQLYLSIYLRVIFKEKEDTDDANSESISLKSKAIQIIKLPIYYISLGVIRVARFLGYTKSSSKRPVYNESGYIEGTLKILCGLSNMLLLAIFGEKMKFLLLMPIAIAFFIFLATTKSSFYGKIIYLITFTLLMTISSLAKACICTAEQTVILSSVCLLIECSLHSGIGFVCRKYKLTASSKALMYSVIAICAFTAALWISFTEDSTPTQ